MDNAKRCRHTQVIAAAERAAAERAAAERAAAERAAAEAREAVKRAATETLTDLLGYAPASVDCAKLGTAILAAREAQVAHTLVAKAEALLQRSQQLVKAPPASAPPAAQAFAPAWVVPSAALRWERELGRGGFGVVYEVTLTITLIPNPNPNRNRDRNRNPNPSS